MKVRDREEREGERGGRVRETGKDRDNEIESEGEGGERSRKRAERGRERQTDRGREKCMEERGEREKQIKVLERYGRVK